MNTRKCLVLLMAVAATGVAQAHGGHPVTEPEFLVGLLHPFSGLDHWLVGIVVGCWAGRVLDRGTAIGIAERILLGVTAAAYGLGHGATLASAGGGVAFAAGFGLSTLALVTAGVALFRVIRARLETSILA